MLVICLQINLGKRNGFMTDDIKELVISYDKPLSLVLIYINILGKKN